MKIVYSSKSKKRKKKDKLKLKNYWMLIYPKHYVEDLIRDY